MVNYIECKFYTSRQTTLHIIYFPAVKNVCHFQCNLLKWNSIRAFPCWAILDVTAILQISILACFISSTYCKKWLIQASIVFLLYTCHHILTFCFVESRPADSESVRVRECSFLLMFWNFRNIVRYLRLFHNGTWPFLGARMCADTIDNQISIHFTQTFTSQAHYQSCTILIMMLRTHHKDTINQPFYKDKEEKRHFEINRMFE